MELHRARDSSYFEDKKAMKLIRETLRKLGSRGVKYNCCQSTIRLGGWSQWIDPTLS